jgi:beta-lactamase regulating signal transducer with metallopeptidase domain
MNLAFPDTDLLSCSAAFLPWVGGVAAKATLLLTAILVAGTLMARRHAALRHLTATIGLACLTLLPLLSLSVTWEMDPGAVQNAASTLAPPASGADQGLLRILVALWGLGAALLLAWLALDLGLLWWHIRRGTLPVEEDWNRRVAELTRRVGIRRHVRVLRTEAFDIPCTWGLARPVVLLPRQALTWSPEQFEAVLLHELGHVRRMDGLVVTLARIACALYWFHPLVWWVQRRAREDAERACDLLVVEEGVAPARYARHLLDIIRSARRPGTALAPTMANPSHMARRIVELTEHRHGASRVGRRGAALVLVALIASTVLLAATSVPGTAVPHREASVCSDAGLPLETQPGPSWEGPQSVEPELFTPMEDLSSAQ